jgi:Tfp pilus assembly protein PilF
VGRENIAIQLAEGYLVAGRFADAEAMAKQALDLSREHRTRGFEAYALYVAAGAVAHRGAPGLDEAAAARYREALALADALAMRPLVAHCHLGLARLHRRGGQPDLASDHLASAVTMYRAMHMTGWLARAEGLRD